MHLPLKMKAVFVDARTGAPVVRETDVPVPKKGEVLVRMHAAPVNPADLARVREAVGEGAVDFIPGTEGCGLVVAAGGGLLPRFYLGRRVACTSHHRSSGTWAEYMVTTAGSCFPVGKKISDEQASMMIVNPMTALALLDIARKGRHRALVSTAANGALGTLIHTFSESRGIEVLNVVRTEEAAGKLEREGRKFVLSIGSAGFLSRLQEWCIAHDCRLMLDAVGGEMVNRVLDVLPDSTRIILYGNLSQQKVEFMPPQVVRRSLRIEGFVLSHWIREAGMVKVLRNLITANRMVKRGLATTVQGAFPLERAEEAVEAYRVEMGKGKVILRP